MNENVIKLHPRNYKKIPDRIIFYMHSDKCTEDEFQSILSELSTCRTFVITSYKKNSTATRSYSLYAGKYVLNFFGSDSLNLQCTRILNEKKAAEQKKKLYTTKIFTIIPEGSVHIVYGNVIYPKSDNNSWKMDEAVFNELLDSMEDYFESDDDEENIDDKKEERIKISDKFRREIIRPFRDYTDKEDWVERYKQSQGEGLLYFKRRFLNKTNKGPVYDFYSNDVKADLENAFFSIGDRITVIDTENTDRGVYTGVLENIDIDSENEDAVVYSLAFYHQLDDVDIPQSGKLVMGINDTQTKVRSRVIRNMERGKLESKYMYKFFDNFSSDGYEEIPDDLKEYLAQKMASKFPPNQMQLEAIIKGILTKDLLLVLGPPGTGKTTVISFWVEYFIKKGMRVLISSQNNSAVDNVLARFGGEGTVRLGNENKVQENCKPYLPQNQIKNMQEHFNNNYKRVTDDLNHNEQELVKYKERLTNYSGLVNDYLAKCEKVEEFSHVIGGMMKAAIESRDNATKLGNELDYFLDEKACREIFLQVYRRKGIITKLFRLACLLRVKKELKAFDEKVELYRTEYMKCVNDYNTSILQIKNMMKPQKARTLLKSYEQTKSQCTSYFTPAFTGEMAALYTAPEPGSRPEDIINLIESEWSKVNALEATITKTKNALADWNGLVNNERNDVLQNVLLESCKIVGATCIGINSNKIFSNIKFDVAIVDESGQIQIHNALIPMSRAKKNLLLGDYKQIPPCANEDVIAACEAEGIKTNLLNKSFFEHVFESIREKEINELKSQGLDKSLIFKPVLNDYEAEPFKNYPLCNVQSMISRVIKDPKKIVNLNSQFRMPGNISDVISEWFYEGNYHSSYNMSNFETMIPGTDKPLVVIPTGKSHNRAESQPASKMGYQNHYEAQLIANIVCSVINSQPEEKKAEFIDRIEDNIGIISAYGAQVRLIREYVSKSKLGIEESQVRSMVASLDSFQGQERPLILYSLTRSTTYKAREAGRVGFMKELRRLNVAFTRCQKQLVVVGDIDYLSECMNMEKMTDDDSEWPCANTEEQIPVGQEYIDQCADCKAICERKFARFMRLLMQHVNEGAGNIIDSESLMRKDA